MINISSLLTKYLKFWVFRIKSTLVGTLKTFIMDFLNHKFSLIWVPVKNKNKKNYEILMKTSFILLFPTVQGGVSSIIKPFWFGGIHTIAFMHFSLRKEKHITHYFLHDKKFEDSSLTTPTVCQYWPHNIVDYNIYHRQNEVYIQH